MVYSPAENHKKVLCKFNWCDLSSQPEFKERGNALLSPSPALAAGRTVEALTGFFFFPLEPNTSGESVEQRMGTGISHEN